MKKDKPWMNMPKVEVIEEHLAGFYRFVYERQMVWFRRFIKKEPPPWTKDKWLRDYKFTNVYRELDRGTIWLMKNVITKLKSWRTRQDEVHMLWNIVLYRLLNRVETFEKVGIPTPFSWKKSEGMVWRGELRLLHETQSVFTNAHLTLPQNKAGASKLDKYFEVLDKFHRMLHFLYAKIKKAKSLEEVFVLLQEIPCVGPFISYEVCIDLMYAKIIPFSEDDWVNAGPGCRVGIRLIFPLRAERKEWVRAIKDLRRNQRKHFSRLGLDFKYFANRELTLRNIEHSLCEFGKYWKLSHGVGKNRMLFRPTSTPAKLLPNGQIPLTF